MYATLLLTVLSGLAHVSAQSEANPNPTIPTIPTSTDQVPTIEGALVYDGPPVIGYTGLGGNASVQSGLPAASYQATLPSTNFDNATGSTITGSIKGTTNANGTGVTFSVNFAGFPSIAAYGPFVYHIHQLPVPADGNCTATMAHLDPTNRGELHACEVMATQTCQAGDLAGKHGNITASTWNVMYTDLYLSTVPGSPYFFGDKSVVVHSRNSTRLTCANFTLVSSSTANGGNTTSSNVTTGTSPSASAFTGDASGTFGSSVLVSAVVAALTAFFL